MDVERRLQRAARELREIEIDVPPLASLGRHRAGGRGLAGRVPALVMPVLFVLGGLAVAAGTLQRGTDSTDDTAAAIVATDRGSDGPQDDVAVDADATSGSVLTAREEIALITSLGPQASTTPASVERSASDLRTLSPRYR